MLKGVNKKIIEVNNPDSVYFEKAVFYLRPHVRELPEAVSSEEINQYIAGIGLKCRRIRLSGAAIFLFTALVLSTAAFIVFKYF
jgi:hypothetical protein